MGGGAEWKGFGAVGLGRTGPIPTIGTEGATPTPVTTGAAPTDPLACARETIGTPDLSRRSGPFISATPPLTAPPPRTPLPNPPEPPPPTGPRGAESVVRVLTVSE